jgi:hypothetical protein
LSPGWNLFLIKDVGGRVPGQVRSLDEAIDILRFLHRPALADDQLPAYCEDLRPTMRSQSVLNTPSHSPVSGSICLPFTHTCPPARATWSYAHQVMRRDACQSWGRPAWANRRGSS